MKIEVQNTQGTSIDVKRFHIPGTVLTGSCPECSEPYHEDFAVRYLSYPTVGLNTHTCYCPECDHEWAVTLKLTLGIELVNLHSDISEDDED